MQFSPEYLRSSSPISRRCKTIELQQTLGEEYICDRLKAVLFTLQAEREDYQQKLKSQRNVLQQKLKLSEEKSTQFQQKNQKLQQQIRQLRFNYHQRGSVVDYLKKKITALEKKFDSEREQMISVIKYLESKNTQLKEELYQLRRKENGLKSDIRELEEKYNSLNTQYECFKKQQFSILGLDLDDLSYQARTRSHRPTCSITPKYQSNKVHHQRKFNQKNNQNNVNLLNRLDFETENELDNLQILSDQQKTVRYEHFQKKKKPQKSQAPRLNQHYYRNNMEIKQCDSAIPRKILINNYGYLNFNEMQHPKEKFNFYQDSRHSNRFSRPKLSLPNRPRNFNQILGKSPILPL